MRADTAITGIVVCASWSVAACEYLLSRRRSAGRVRAAIAENSRRIEGIEAQVNQIDMAAAVIGRSGIVCPKSQPKPHLKLVN